MLNKDSGQPIQAMPLSRGDAVSPYTVQETDVAVEFTAPGTVTITDHKGIDTVTTVLGGARYSIDIISAKTITFSGTFNIG